MKSYPLFYLQRNVLLSDVIDWEYLGMNTANFHSLLYDLDLPLEIQFVEKRLKRKES